MGYESAGAAGTALASWLASVFGGSGAAGAAGAAGAGAGTSALSSIAAPTAGGTAVEGMGSGAEALLSGGQLATGSGASGTTPKSPSEILGKGWDATKRGLGAVGDAADSPSGQAAMRLMQLSASGKPSGQPAVTPLQGRGSSATQPSVANFLKLLQQRNPVALRMMPGMGG